MLPRGPRWCLLLVVGAALLAFAAVLHGSFVNWDDSWLIVRNPMLRGARHLGTILDPTADRILLGAEYLPVRDLSNAADHFLFGTEPTGYRLGNWLLHGLAAGLAFAVLLEVLGSPSAALAAALLWAVHPMRAESVAWASARKDLLNAAFALLAALLYLRSARTGSRALAAGAAGAFLLATLSKTSAAALPFLLAGGEVLTGDRARPLGARLRAALLRAAPLMAVAVAGAALNSWHQQRAHVRLGWRGGGYLENLFVMGGVHLRQIGQTLLPRGMAADYDVGADAPFAAGHVAGVAVVAVLAGATLGALRRGAAAGLCGAWWFGMMAPVSNVIVPIANASADRYTGLPSLGVCALAGMGFERWRSRGPGAARWAGGTLAAAVLALGVAGAAQARVWRDGVALWGHAVAVSPGVGRAWENYGEALAAAGRREEAFAAWREMVRAEPRNPALRVHLAKQLWEGGRLDRAAEVEALLRQAVDDAGPADATALYALASFANERGRNDEAVAMLQECVRRQPGLAVAHMNLGLWHQSAGRPGEARAEFEEALRLGLDLHGQSVSRDALADIAARAGDEEGARRHREERDRVRALSRGE